MRYYNLLTLFVSFSLYMGAFMAAQIDDVPVQNLEFEEYVITPRIEVIEFEEYVITAQNDDVDDGDGENIDMMNAFWCDIWPDDVKCINDEDDDKEEEGC